MTTAPLAPPHTPVPRLAVIGIALAAVVTLVVIAFLWPTVASAVRGIPIGIVGTSAQTTQFEKGLRDASPHTFTFTEPSDRAAAVRDIKTRAIYGAIVLGQSPAVLTASAGSPIVSQLLTSFAPSLQAQLNAAAAAQGVTLPSSIVVKVTDVVPLASTDPRGAGLTASSFPLVLGGMLGGIGISFLIVGVWRRVAAVIVYVAVAGLALASIMQGWFGALQGNYFVNAAAIALALLSISGVIVGFVALVGRAGTAVGPVVYLLIANPLSAAAQPVEFIAKPWGAVGQWLPPGAAATLLRDLSYFPKAHTTFPWLVLAGWAAGGLLISVAGHFRNTGAATRAAILEAEIDSGEPVHMPKHAASVQ